MPNFGSIFHLSSNKVIANFPLLEDLNISESNALEGLCASSRSLKHLKLMRCEELEKAEIDAPSLLTLKYQGFHVLSLSLNNASEEFTASFAIYQYEQTDGRVWFHKLKELLTTVTRADIWFFIRPERPGISVGADLDFRANPLPLEHQDDNFRQSSIFLTFADNLFSISRPTSISFSCIYITDFDFMEFLGNELMRSRESKCYNSRKIKCWGHYVEDIRPEIYKKDQGAHEWQLLHWQNFIRYRTSIVRGMEIRFSLKWYEQLHVQD